MSKTLRNVLDSNIFFISVITLITLFLFKPLFSEGYPSWADNSTVPVLNMSRFNSKSNFTYAEHYHGLIYNANEILMNFIPNKISLILNIFTEDTRILSILWVVLPYIVMNICMYLSLFNVFEEKRLSFLLTLFFMFSPLSFSQIAYGWSWPSYSIAFGLLFISYLIKYLRYPRFKYVVIMSLVSVIGTINIANFYAFVVGALVYFLLYVVINKLNFKVVYKNYKGILFLPIISILINLYWIIPTIPMSENLAQNFFLTDIYPSSILTSINTFSFTTTFATFDAYQNVFRFFNSNFFIILNYLFLLVVFYYVLKNLNNSLLALFFSLYLFFFGLSLGKNFSILWKPFQILPGAYIIRSPQLKFFPVLFYFLSLSVGWIIKEYKPKLLIYTLYVVIVLGIFGFCNGNLFSYWGNVTPPEDYKEVVEKLDTRDSRYETVAVFPKIWGMTTINWLDDRYASPIMHSMIYNPLIIYNNWNTSVVPTYIKDAYIDPLVNIPEVLGSGNVKYVLVHKDYSNYSVDMDLFNTEGFTKIAGGENIDLFEVSDHLYKGLFYSGEMNLSYERISPVMHTFKLDPGRSVTFNRQHDVSLKLYDRKDIEETGYYDCNFKIGDLNFCDILLLKVKPLPKQPIGKDYKNNWILPENSSGSYVVYYEPQIYFYIGLIISFVAFILHVLYLLLAKESDKNKQVVLN